MRKFTPMLLSYCTIIVLSAALSSCKDDDDPKTKPKLSFAESTMQVSEGGGVIEIEILLDRPASKDIVVDYEVGGTAIEGSAASADYEINGDFGEVEIAAGETTGIIEIEIKQDAVFEGNETIEISIEDVNSDDIDISNDDEIEITITEDDPQALASMAVAALTVSEDEGLIEIEVELDQAASTDITVQYTLSGSAIDSLTAWEEDLNADYYIDGVSGEVVIESGETIGIIRLQLFSDILIEDSNPNNNTLDPENIIITLTSGSNGVGIGENDVMDITLVQEDGRLVFLEWNEDANADMDMFLWMGNLGETAEDLGFSGLASTNPGTDGAEAIFIPDVLPQIVFDGNPDAAFGLSYTYWGGESDDLDFTATFIDIENGVVEGAGGRDSFTATYTLANINEWDNQQTGTNPIIVQTFDKEDGTYKNVTGITVPGAGSRVRGAKLPSSIKRENGTSKRSNIIRF
jgi:hypothetical protein